MRHALYFYACTPQANLFSTLTILAIHAQSIALIGGLHLDWPVSVQLAMSALSLDMLQLPEAACLVGSGALSPFWLYSTAYCGAVLALPNGRGSCTGSQVVLEML